MTGISATYAVRRVCVLVRTWMAETYGSMSFPFSCQMTPSQLEAYKCQCPRWAEQTSIDLCYSESAHSALRWNPLKPTSHSIRRAQVPQVPHRHWSGIRDRRVASHDMNLVSAYSDLLEPTRCLLSRSKLQGEPFPLPLKQLLLRAGLLKGFKVAKGCWGWNMAEG